MKASNDNRLLDHKRSAEIITGYRPQHGVIYYIGSAETQRVKIGFTKGDPRNRLRALQTGSPTRLGFMAAHWGTPEVEKELHGIFGADRLHGEWFEFSEPLIEHMFLICWLTVGAAKNAGWEAPSWAKSGLEALCVDEDDLPDWVAEMLE